MFHTHMDHGISVFYIERHFSCELPSLHFIWLQRFQTKIFSVLIPWIIISRAGLGNPAAIHLYLTQF